MCKPANLQKIPLVVSILGILLLGAVSRAQVSNPMSNTRKAKPGNEFEKLLLPADLKKMADSTRKLAEQIIPKPEVLEANGNWKLPWEFPHGLRVPLPEDVEERFSASLYRMPKERYWTKRAELAGFVGLTEEEGTKRKNEILGLFALAKGELEKQGFGPRQAMFLVMSMPNMFHPSSPTLAASLKGKFKAQINVVSHLAGDPNKTFSPAERQKMTLDMFESMYPGVKEDEIPARIIEAFTLNQRWTRFALCRANDWTDLIRIGEAKKGIDDLIRKYRPELGDGPIGQIFPDEKTYQDPAWKPANERYTQALAGYSGVEELIRKKNIGISTAVVNVRFVNPDALSPGGLVKDLSQDDAANLEEQMNATFKKAIEFATPRIEREIEENRKSISMWRAAGNNKQADQTQEYLNKKLMKWQEQKAAKCSVNLITDIGADNCYTVSYSRVGEVDDPTSFMILASIRNGNVLAEIAVFSMMTEVEAKRDMKFLLKELQEKTSAFAGKTTPK